MIKNLSSDFNLVKEFEKINSIGDSSQKGKELIRLGLMDRAATRIEIDSKTLDHIPVGKVRMEWDRLLHKACNQNLDTLIYEYAFFATKNNQCVPLNNLIDFIEYINKNLSMVAIILPILGEAGIYLIRKNKNWSYLSPENIEVIKDYKDSRQKVHIVKYWLGIDPKLSMEFLIQNISAFKDREISDLLEYIFQKKIIISESAINKIKPSTNLKNKLLCISILFLNPASEFTIESKKIAEPFIQGKEFEKIGSKEIFKTKSDLNLKSAIQYIPPVWILEKCTPKEWFDFLYESDLLEDYASIIQTNKDLVLATHLIDYLLQHDLFTEHFPLDKLSSILDYNTFNRIAHEYLQRYEDKADLEAFLHFSNYYKHFWSDDLIIDLLKLSKYKTILKKYNLDVFYEQIPYRMNPNSSILGEIRNLKDPCMNEPLNMELIIQFRQILRK